VGDLVILLSEVLVWQSLIFSSFIYSDLISYVLDSSMEDTEAMDSRTPLAALSPSRQNTEGAGDVDFSKLTPSQFGISTDSFLPSSKIKG